jgi:hypothetical protein
MLKKIPVEELRLGMHLHAMCGAWLEHPFWRTKFVLRDPVDLDKLRTSSVAEVWIDLSKGSAVWQSKCNTFFNEVGRDGETASFLNRQEVEGDRWNIASSPKANDTPWPT